MFDIIRKILKIIHSVVLSLAVFTVLPALGIFLYEQSRTFDHYLKYYHAIPYKTEYDVGEFIKFYSFYQFHSDVEVKWRETVWCNAGGDFNSTITSSVNEITRSPQFYPDDILSILNEVHEKNDTRSDVGEYDQVLRDYATRTQTDGYSEGSEMVPWTLKLRKPKAGSVCHTRHRMELKTPFFNIIKYHDFFSSSWRYGKLPE